MCRGRAGRGSLAPGPGGKSALVPGCPSSRQGRRLGGRPGEACELGGAASLEARLSWEGEPCTWHRREMPPSAPPGVRAGVARAAPERSPREAGACSSGRRGVLPGGDHTAGLARGRGEGPAGVARGMAGRRGMAGTRGSPGARGPRHPGRPPSGGGLPSQAEAGGRPRDLLPAGGQGALPLGPDSWAGERGPRDAGAARARVEAGAVGPRVWSPVPVGAARLGAPPSRGWRGRRGRGGEPPEAASVGGAAPAGGRRGWVGRGPPARAGRVGGAPQARSAAAPGRRAAVGLPRGPGGSASRSEAEARGWAARGCNPGSSSSPSDPAPASARGGSEARPPLSVPKGTAARGWGGGRWKGRAPPEPAPPRCALASGWRRRPRPLPGPAGAGARAQEVGER